MQLDSTPHGLKIYGEWSSLKEKKIWKKFHFFHWPVWAIFLPQPFSPPVPPFSNFSFPFTLGNPEWLISTKLLFFAHSIVFRYVFFPPPPHPFIEGLFAHQHAHTEACHSQNKILKISNRRLSLSVLFQFMGRRNELHLIWGLFMAHRIFWKPHKMAPPPLFLWGEPSCEASRKFCVR